MLFNGHSFNRYQYLLAVVLAILLFFLCYLLGDMSTIKSLFLLLIFSIILTLGFSLIARRLLGLYIIIAAMCLSGGVLSMNIGEGMLTFFSDLPLPLNFNLFELLSMGVIGISYAWFCLRKELILFEETKIGHAIYLFSSALVISWIIHSIKADTLRDLYELRRLMYIPLIFILMINLVKTEAHLESVLNLFIICIGMKGTIGLIEAILFGKFTFLYETWAESTLFLTAFFFLFALQDNCPGHPMLKRIKPFVIPMVFCFLFSTRRTLWASLVLTLLLYCFLFKKSGRLKFSFFLSLAAILFVSATYLSGDSKLIDELNSMKNPIEAHTFALRQWEWKNAWEYIKMKPFIGHGLGSILLPIVDFKYIFRTGFTSIIFHNNYLWIWVKAGLVSLVPFLLLIFISIRETYKLYKGSTQSFNRAILLGIFLSIINFTIAGFISPTMADLQINVWLGFCLGVIALIKRFDRGNKIEDQRLINHWG